MVGTLRVNKIKFYAGSSPGKAGLDVKMGKVLIIVGPNNSGKSLALREIEGWCFGQDNIRKVVDIIDVDFPTDPDEAFKLLKQFEATPPPNRMPQTDIMWVGQHVFNQSQNLRHSEVNITGFKNGVAGKNLGTLRGHLSAYYTIRLDGRTRFSLVDDKPTGDLQSFAQNHLWALFKDDTARERVRELTEEAFGLHFVIDPTAMQSFRIRLSARKPTSKSEEQGLDGTARKFHAAAPTIKEFSDGVQAFIGLVSAVLSLRHKIILLDEPEAFLHPPLARRLGANMSQIAADRDASLVVATHSADFVMGCLQNEKDTSVVRLTYEDGTATARVMESTDLSTLMYDPLLRSTGELRALFHRAVVVTESDTDRAFYDEINRRLEDEDRGIKDSLFLNGQNKQTVHRLVAPLRRLGIPAGALVDLDMIKESGSNWSNLLQSCQVDATEFVRLDSERAYLHGVFQGLPALPDGREPMKVKGIHALNTNDKQRAEALLKDLAKYGIFLVPVGELESWLATLGASGHGADWLVQVFSRIGQADTDPNYVKASNGDVWDFLDTIAVWAQDPNRLGTQ